MNHATRTIIAALIVAVIAFFVGYGVAPRQAKAPTSSQTTEPITETNSDNSSATTHPTTTAAIPSDAIVIPVSIVTIRQTASTSPTVTVEYPQFPSLSASFNAAIASSTLSRIAEFRREVADSEKARAAAGPAAAIPPSAYSFIATWQPDQINSSYVSFIERYDSFSGGASEVQDLQTFNYDTATKKQIALGDLFPNTPDYSQQISEAIQQQLTGIMDQPTSYPDFTFTDYEITVYFPECSISACSNGEQKITVPRNTPTAD